MKTEDIEDWKAHVRNVAKENFEESGSVRPVILLLVTRHPKTGERLPGPEVLPVVPSRFDAGTKGDFASAARDIAKQCEAVLCVFITETWFHDTLTLEEYAGLRKAGKSLEDAAGRQEMVMISYEERGKANSSVWMAPIVRAGAKPTLGEFKELDANRSAGIFTKILPQVS